MCMLLLFSIVSFLLMTILKLGPIIFHKKLKLSICVERVVSFVNESFELKKKKKETMKVKLSAKHIHTEDIM